MAKATQAQEVTRPGDRLEQSHGFAQRVCFVGLRLHFGFAKNIKRRPWQTFGLRTGSHPVGDKTKNHQLKADGFCFGDPYGNRTHVTAVKGRCLNRLTNGPLW